MSVELNVPKLAGRTKFLLTLMILLIFVVIFQYWFYPQWINYQQIIEEKKSYEQKLALISKMTGELSPEKKEQLINELSILQKKLGSGLEIGQAIKDLVDIETNSSAKIMSVEFMPETELDGFTLETINMKAKGNFLQLIRLIQGIEGLDYYILTESMQMTTEKKEVEGKEIPFDVNKLEVDLKFMIIRIKNSEYAKIEPSTLPIESAPFSLVTREKKS